MLVAIVGAEPLNARRPLSDRFRYGAIPTERQATVAIASLFTTVEHTPRTVEGRRQLAAELQSVAGIAADPSARPAQSVRARSQQGVAEASDGFAAKTRAAWCRCR